MLYVIGHGKQYKAYGRYADISNKQEEPVSQKTGDQLVEEFFGKMGRDSTS